MDGLSLLREARWAGLLIRAEGHRLVVEGPRRLEAVAHEVLVHKPAIMAVLAQEEPALAWRVNAMRRQATTSLPLLLARPGVSFPAGSCCSCGDALVAKSAYRCDPCVTAVTVVLSSSGSAGRLDGNKFDD